MRLSTSFSEMTLGALIGAGALNRANTVIKQKSNFFEKGRFLKLRVSSLPSRVVSIIL